MSLRIELGVVELISPQPKRMQEVAALMDKYDAEYLRVNLEQSTDLNLFAMGFFEDAIGVYDAVTRVRNLERNPVGFDLNDAPILGLLIRVWKLLREIARYYKENNAEVNERLFRKFDAAYDA